MRTDNRAATEVLGFILAFAIITAAIGIVYTSGFGGLQDVRDDEQLKNVERAFDVLASNIEDVRRFGTPSRSTEIRLRDGRLVLGPQSILNVSVDGTVVVSTSMRPITYVSNDEDTRITYEGGSVFRASEGNAVLLSRPGWILTEDRFVIPAVVTFRSDGPNSLSTAGTALLISQSFGREVQRFSGTDMTVNVTVNTTAARAGAWLQYFRRLDATSPPDGNFDTSKMDEGQISYVVTVDHLRVIRSLIGLTLSP